MIENESLNISRTYPSVSKPYRNKKIDFFCLILSGYIHISIPPASILDTDTMAFLPYWCIRGGNLGLMVVYLG